MPTAVVAQVNNERTGIGEEPHRADIEVPADLALETAHLTALEKLLQTNTDDLLTGEFHESIETVKMKLEEMKKKRNAD